MSPIVSKLFALAIFVIFAGCNYNKFDDISVADRSAPWSPTTTIDKLTLSMVYNRSTIVEAVAITSDSAGSFYRQIILEDFATNNAITINLGFYDIYAWLRTGMVVAVDMQGLAIVDSAGVRMVGLMNADGSVAEIGSPTLAARHLHFQGRYAPLEPPVRTIEQISRSDLGHLITIEKCYFLDGGTYEFSGERPVGQLFSTRTIPLYTSAYTTFSYEILPTSIASRSFVVTEFNGRLQLKVSSSRF